MKTSKMPGVLCQSEKSLVTDNNTEAEEWVAIRGKQASLRHSGFASHILQKKKKSCPANKIRFWEL